MVLRGVTMLVLVEDLQIPRLGGNMVKEVGNNNQISIPIIVALHLPCIASVNDQGSAHMFLYNRENWGIIITLAL